MAAQHQIDQDRWVIQIKDCLDEDQEEENEISVCVFNVPKELLAVKPEAYIPQSVSIGPYHQWRSELYDMERYKVAAARRFQKRIPGQKFESVVEEAKKYEWRIRSCHHKYLDYSDEALAWLMALDGSFVLECLQFYARQTDQAEAKQLGKFLDASGRSATHNAIIRDLMMLENQMPLFLLQKLLEMQLGCNNKAEESLQHLITLACKEFSPFMVKMQADNSRVRINERGHILEVLYYSLVLPAATTDDSIDENEPPPPPPPPDTTRVMRAFNLLWKALSSLNCVRPVRRLMAPPRRVLKLLFRLLSTLGSLPVLRSFKSAAIVLLRSGTAKQTNGHHGERQSSTPPTRDELAIASVSDLFSAGIKFLPTDGDLTTIRFNHTNSTLYLPKVKLDANTEVILRNLVAFEASADPAGALVITRYTDFMNGMIDSKEDVRLLRNSGIIYNYLESDAMVASMWNGMGKCVKMTKVKQLDQVITEVNKFYNRKWSVAVVEYVKTYVFGYWKFLSMLAALILLLLTCLEAFCFVYNCKQWFNNTSFLED